MTLNFVAPLRLTDDSQQKYFKFNQTVKNTNYNVLWRSKESFVVPDDVLTSIVEEFLQFASSFFVKPPSVETMKKHIEHVMIDKLTLSTMKDSSDIYECILFPSSVNVYSKKTVINWDFYHRSILETPQPQEQIPSDFLTDSRPSSPRSHNDTRNIVITSDPVQNAIMEAVADIPLQETHPFRLDDDAEERMYRLRVMEARLSAKLASFKAQKEREKYYSKFGRLPPDVDDSGDETDYSGTTDEDDSQNE